MNRAVTLLITFALLAPFALAAGNNITAHVSDAPQWQRASLDLTNAIDQTTLVVPADLPAPAATSGIGPGSHLFISKAGGTYGCTANWLWTAGGKTYIGAAGHCFLPEGKTATHGPGKDYNRFSSSVSVCVAECDFGGQAGFVFRGTTVALGPVAYARQTAASGPLGNDFGIVEVPAALAHYLRPEMPVWGGVSATREMSIGAPVCIYGNGVAVGETWPTMARMGVSGGAWSGGAWRADIAAAPGDSGSAIATCDGVTGDHLATYASGLLTHIAPGVVTGLIAGTTMWKAEQMALEAGLVITPRFA